jgi:hypothetical protein
MRRVGLALFILAAFPAQASAAGTPQVTVTPDVAGCKATVVVTWTGDRGSAGVQVNVDNRGAQDDAKVLQLPGGDTLVATPGAWSYEFTLAPGAAHVVDAWTQGHGINLRQTATVDCTVAVPPVIQTITVPGPERLIPGPERVVKRPVAARCRAAYNKAGRRVLVCPRVKRQDCKRPRVWHPGAKRCVTPRKARKRPAFTG